MKAPSYQPSAQEIAAQKAAENDKIESIQDKLRGDTERMFRIFGASGAMSGKSASFGKL
jgi:hypothetical protein